MKRLVYVVNKLDYFLSHRLPLAQAAMQKGYEVHVICPLASPPAIEGMTFHRWHLSRSGLNPWQEWKSLQGLKQLLVALKPDLVHAITIKPVIYTGMLRRLKSFTSPWLATIPGMGYVFAEDHWKRRLLQRAIGHLYRWALNKNHAKVIFQNRDDHAFFLQHHWVSSQDAALILGSGVCPHTYLPQIEPPGPVVVILPSRLLKDKGVVEWVEAIKLIKHQVDARFALVGECDEGNLASLHTEDIEAWVAEGWVEYWGWQEDMIAQFAKAHVVCLPSYREGLPKVLIEAASCEKAIVTTDVPGCREIVKHEETGLMVPAREIEPLAEAMLRLIKQADLREKLGKSARVWVLDALSLEHVNQKTLALYQTQLP